TSGTEVETPLLQDADALENNWRGLVDVVDQLLEKADTALDEYTGIIKRPSPAQQEQAPSTFSTPRPSKSLRNPNIPKPQLLFHTGPTNNDTTPFKPLLSSKPHAIIPLDQSLSTFLNEEGLIEYRHPYETEITQSEYPSAAYIKSEPVPYSPLEATKAIFVDTPEALASMLIELKTAKEIAVDLEHHDTRSYIGLVSLMQISTRSKDWIVDTLKPWRRDLQVLNEVFADPTIVKVFHGAFMDIIWLQRDFGLYVVGLFDTFHAARELGYPKASLAALLLKFVKFNAEKQYQMADWRIRPLPDEMFNYARSDTHFLLYIYDNLRNELIDKSSQSNSGQNSVNVVLQNSKATALDRYTRQGYDLKHGRGPTGWYAMLSRTPALFTKEQFAVFRAVHHWRDSVARREDESLHYVMPRQVMFSIARAMPLDKPSLLSVSQPITQLVRSRADELVAAIIRAKAVGAQGPEMIDVLRPHNEVRLETEPAVSPLPDAPVKQTKPVEDATSVTAGDVYPIRSASSRFWGSSFGSSLWREPTQAIRINEGLQLALPLPQLTAEIFENPRGGSSKENMVPIADPGARAEHQYVKARPQQVQSDQGVFIVKELGTARKRKAGVMPEQEDPITETTQAIPDGVERAADEIRISVDVEETQQKARLKAERKAAKRAKKKMERESHKGKQDQANAVMSDGTRGIDQDGQPPESFDYANAESVLHAKRDQTEGSGSRKSFNPYSKSADAPKGIRQTKKEKAGKSFTFKK
ncbi:MAG: exosome nuclease subunit, partial [Candelina submexicana]